jgi:ribosomal protein L20
MLAQLWRSRLRYYSRYHGTTYNRLVHALVRLGLRGRGGVGAVRQLLA